MNRRQKYARAIWAAMVDDEPPPDDDAIWREGYLNAADAVIALADIEGTQLPQTGLGEQPPPVGADSGTRIDYWKRRTERAEEDRDRWRREYEAEKAKMRRVEHDLREARDA